MLAVTLKVHSVLFVYHSIVCLMPVSKVCGSANIRRPLGYGKSAGAVPVVAGTVGYQEVELAFASTARTPGYVPFQTRRRRAEKPDTHIVDCSYVRLQEKAPLVKGGVLAGGPSGRLSTPTPTNNHLLPVYNKSL